MILAEVTTWPEVAVMIAMWIPIALMAIAFFGGFGGGR